MLSGLLLFLLTSPAGMRAFFVPGEKVNSIVFKSGAFAHFYGDLIPQTKESTGADLHASEDKVIPPGRMVIIGTGVRVTDCSGVDIQVRGRSGLAAAGILCHVGTIDKDYRGEIKVMLFNSTLAVKKIIAGERIAQLVVNEYGGSWHDVIENERIGGFGSTGG